MNSDYGFNAASFILTNACNLDCTYCFEGKNKKKVYMTKEIAESGVEFLISQALEHKKDDIDITFFGGEPTLNIPVMEHLLIYGLKRSKECNLKFKCMLITNGVIYTDEYEDFLIKWWINSPESFNIQLSFDSIPKIHDLQRVDCNGNGSSEKILKSLDKIIQLFKKFNIPIERLCIHSVVSKKTLPYVYDSYKFFKYDMGLENKSRIWFMALHEEDWDDNDYKLYKELYTKIANDIIKECKESDNDYPYNQFSELIKKKDHNTKTCAAGVSYCAITPGGDIYPCHGFMSDKSTKIGTLDEGVDKLKCEQYIELYRKYMTGYKTCSDCKNYNCRSCIATNYNYNGNIAYGFPKYCKIIEIQQEISNWLYNEIYWNEIMEKSNKLKELMETNFTKKQQIVLYNIIELNNKMLREEFKLKINELRN